MFRWQLIAVNSIIAISFASAQTPKSPNRVAVLIGVNHDAEGKRSAIKFAEREMSDFEHVLKAGGFGVTTLLGNGKDEKEASLKNIESSFKQTLASCEDKDDVAIITISSRGKSIKRGNRNSIGIQLKTTNWEKDDEFLELNKLMSLRSKTSQGRLIVLLDVSRDETALELPKSKDLPDNVAIFCSAAAGQKSYESDQIGHGLFFHFVIEGLRGKARYGSDSVHFENLVAYAKNETSSQFGELVEGTVRQTPKLLGELSDNPTITTKDRGFLRSHTLSPGIKDRTNSIGMRLVKIEPGTFLMGTNETVDSIRRNFDETADFANELPQHKVRLTRAFYMGTCEVSVREFREFIDSTKYMTDVEKSNRVFEHLDPQSGNRNIDESKTERVKLTWNTVRPEKDFKQRDDYPVTLVTWNDAKAFCQWLSKKEGVTYRLPTEAEWEYAGKAGTTTRYWTGDDPESLLGHANVPDESFRKWWEKQGKPLRYATIKGDDGFIDLAPIGSFKPNAFGLHDTHGNVWEWCEDWFDAKYYENSPFDDPPGPSKSPTDRRCIRGGCYT